MASLRARLLESFLRTVGLKTLTNTLFDALFPNDAKHAKPSLRMRWRHRVATRQMMGRTVYTVAPKSGASIEHIYYLHGGAYYNGFIPAHWHLLNRLVSETKCTVTAPDFPLSPEAGVDDIFAMVLPLYRELLAQKGAENLTVMGDSSGGGMALALAQKARDAGLQQPRDLVLLSPWLDVTMSNPGIPEADRQDPLLGLHAVISAGKRYAKDDDPKRPDISPIYGRLDGLGPITLYVGTHEVMLPDCRKLKDMAAAAGIPFDYREGKDMIHCWMLLKLPESAQAQNEIISIIQRVRSARSSLSCDTRL